MKIVVLEHPRVRSRFHFNDIANTPLWSCLMGGYVSAFLTKNGFDVTYIDAPTEGLTFEDTKHRIIEIRPDLLTVNAVYIWENTHILFDFLKDLKEALTNLHINLFGFFPSLGYYGILKNSDCVDSTAVGEAEVTLLELAQFLEVKGDITSLAGIVTKNTKRLKRFRTPQKDLDIFPFPHRVLGKHETINILGSRGCYNHCSFCPIPTFYNQGPLWRGRSVENILEEIAELLAMGYKDFYFVDPNFIGPGIRGKDRAKRLLSEIKRHKITFGLETRVQDIDDEMAAVFSESGVKSLLLGIESACPNVLEKICKRTSTICARHAIECLRKYDIEPEIGFIMFEPDMRKEDIIQNLNFLIENNLLDRLDRTVNLLSHKLIIFFGTPGYYYYNSQNRVKALDPYGFEVEVSYKNDEVTTIAEVINTFCLYVLEEMSKKESPIYWEKSMYNEKPKEMNNLLVELFRWVISLNVNNLNKEGIIKEGIGQINRTLNSVPGNKDNT